LYEARQINDPGRTSFGWAAIVFAGSWITFMAAWMITAIVNPRVADNRRVGYAHHDA
jgi:hypothetical protein